MVQPKDKTKKFWERIEIKSESNVKHLVVDKKNNEKYRANINSSALFRNGLITMSILAIAELRKYHNKEDGRVAIFSIVICVGIIMIWYSLRSRVKKKEQKKMNKKMGKVNDYISKHFLRFMLISSLGLILIVILWFALLGRMSQ